MRTLFTLFLFLFLAKSIYNKYYERISFRLWIAVTFYENESAHSREMRTHTHTLLLIWNVIMPFTLFAFVVTVWTVTLFTVHYSLLRVHCTNFEHRVMLDRCDFLPLSLSLYLSFKREIVRSILFAQIIFGVSHKEWKNERSETVRRKQSCALITFSYSHIVKVTYTHTLHSKANIKTKYSRYCHIKNLTLYSKQLHYHFLVIPWKRKKKIESYF